MFKNENALQHFTWMKSVFTGKILFVVRLVLFFYVLSASHLYLSKKTLTLRQFEEKYAKQIIKLAQGYKTKNIWMLYKQLPEADQKNPKLIETSNKGLRI